ncbi:MAG: YabP/YqfC family sporulation protein [Clostridium fessum]
MFGRQKKRSFRRSICRRTSFSERCFCILPAVGRLWWKITGAFSFSDEMLRLTGKNTRLTIKGKGLSIEYYDRDNLRVTGRLCLSNLGCCEE